MNDLFLLVIILTAIIGTPGPNNTVLFLSGLNKGYRNSFKLLFIINFGVVIMVTISSTAVNFISSVFTIVEDYLLVLSTILLMYISYKTWPKKNAACPKNVDNTNTAMFFFQFINPKIWLASITVATTFQNRLSIFSIVFLTIIVGLSLNSLWVMSGVGVEKMQLKTPNETLSKIGAIILFLSTLLFLFGYVLQKT